MSYDIDLKDPETKETVILNNKHHITGGTYCVGGTREATLNITYNYGDLYYKHISKENGIRHIYGMKAIDSIPILSKVASQLKDNIDEDYWKPTEGNAKKALLDLIALACIAIQECPDCYWDGD